LVEISVIESARMALKTLSLDTTTKPIVSVSLRSRTRLRKRTSSPERFYSRPSRTRIEGIESASEIIHWLPSSFFLMLFRRPALELAHGGQKRLEGW
jgi:hypothetical protein